MKRWLPSCCVLFISLSFDLAVSRAEDLACLASEAIGGEPAVTWYADLQAQAYAALDRRRETFEQLETPEQIYAYQDSLRDFFLRQLGDFPARCPLNSRMVGTVRREGYRIEKVIFASQPNHHVTGNVYVPDGTGPFPGVIVSSGHSRTAKTADYNQRFGILLAQHGLLALCFDPIGQGERSQILTPDGKPRISATTQEHMLMGISSLLVGRNTATYRVWDAMRAIDYLQSRSDVDPQRIGMTGCSGGGTLTSYVMALDSRIACAAPACYLTTFRRLLETIGPQDAEQNIFGQLAFGLDQPDYVLLRAPKPTLISSTTSDFFDIAGAWDNFRQAKRIYTRLGASERVDLVEAAGNHGVQPANLAAIAQWMRRWLLGEDRAAPAVDFTDFDILAEDELRCTERGQVLLLPGERSVFDLNAELEQRYAAEREKHWQSEDEEQLRQQVRQVTGIRPPDRLPTATSTKAGRVEREGYHIDKLVLHTDSSTPLPALTYHPVDPHDAAYLYVHDGGKAADGQLGGPIEDLVRQGYVVVSVDLRGQGETARDAPDALASDWKTFFLAYLLGQSVVAPHAEDILFAHQWVANYESQQPREVHLVAVGQTAVAALHAAALNPDLFSSVTLRDAPSSWTNMVGSVTEANSFSGIVPSAMQTYDLPNLVQLLPNGKFQAAVDVP